jgi:hypothetical protein
MAQRTQVVLTVDIDGSEAEKTVPFGLDGTEYEIDLGKQHADQLSAVIEPYIRVVRRAGSAGRSDAHSAGATALGQSSESGPALIASRRPTAGGYRRRSWSDTRPSARRWPGRTAR